MSLYVGPDGTRRLGNILRSELGRGWSRLQFASAYVKMSGLDHLHDLFEAFASSPGRVVRASVGIDQHGTSYEALAALLEIFAPHNHELFVCHNPRSKAWSSSPTFHPKAWLFDDGINAVWLAGSGNLTQGGLYTNHEIGTVHTLTLAERRDRRLFDDAQASLDRWADPGRGDVRILSSTLLNDLYNANLVLSEDEIRRAARVASRSRVLAGKHRGPTSVGAAIFQGEEFDSPPAPEGGRRPRVQAPAEAADPPTKTGIAPSPVLPQHRSFYIHLAKANKTELYLAQAPLREDPAFFGLPFTGRTQPRRRGNPPQPQADPWPICDVTVIDGTGVKAQVRDQPTKMWQYMEGDSANQDVRIYITAELQRAIADGSICVIQRDPRGGVDYAIIMVAPDHPDFAKYDAQCVTRLPNSQRRYGWS